LSTIPGFEEGKPDPPRHISALLPVNKSVCCGPFKMATAAVAAALGRYNVGLTLLSSVSKFGALGPPMSQ